MQLRLLILTQRNIRDCLVEKIWEGTIVVLSLDVVRAASKPGVLNAWTTVSADIFRSSSIANR